MTTHATASIQGQFTAAASAYTVSSVHAAGKDLAVLAEAAALTGVERVLDIGTGVGFTALRLAPQAREVVGIDITPAMLDQARALAAQRGVTNARFEEADGAALPYPDASFDLVACRYCAHHFVDPLAVLREAARVLRPGGRMLLADTVAHEDPAHDTFLNAVELLRDRSHVRDWRASEWVRMFQQCGFARAAVLDRDAVVLDGDDWVRRMNTPPTAVAMLKELLREANPAQRAAFDIIDDPWGLSLPTVLVEGVKA
ncbi:MAG: class I SAM-dependent methyltransferase [Dehalococcoidia bacterium]|nr:class I SAM-dependent methyltransferase [Dehalococcoidia bacterium]